MDELMLHPGNDRKAAKRPATVGKDDFFSFTNAKPSLSGEIGCRERGYKVHRRQQHRSGRHSELPETLGIALGI